MGGDVEGVVVEDCSWINGGVTEVKVGGIKEVVWVGDVE